MPSIEQTIDFIIQAHAGQKDKSDQPYYLHPIAVMKRLPDYASDDVKKAALLHDVIEDTDYTRDDLSKMGYSDACLDIVDIVTNDAEDGQFDYNAKIDAIINSQNEGAILVKHADMSENNDPTRLINLPQAMRKRFEKKYRKPLKDLEKAIEGISLRFKKVNITNPNPNKPS